MAAGQAELKQPAVRVTVMDEYATVHAWLNQKVISGEMSAAEAQERMRQYESGAKSWTPVAKDGLGNTKLIYKIATDMKTIWGRVYFKAYKGVDYIIIKGRPAVRQLITGTRYKTTNPKMVELQLGRAGLKGAARESFIFGAIFVTAIDIADYFLRDSATLGELVGNVGVDIAKVAVASAAGYAVGALLVGTVVGTFALGPLVIAFGAAIAVGYALDWLDERFGLTARLSKMLDKAFTKVEQFFREKAAEAEVWAKRIANSQTVTDLTHHVEDWWNATSQAASRVSWSYLATSSFYGI